MASKNIMARLVRVNAPKLGLVIINKKLKMFAQLRRGWQINEVYREICKANPWTKSWPAWDSLAKRRMRLRSLIGKSVPISREIFDRIGAEIWR